MRKLIKVISISLTLAFFVCGLALAAPVQCPNLTPIPPTSDWTIVGSPSGDFSTAVVAVTVDDLVYCYYNLNQGMGFLQSNFQVDVSSLNPQYWKKSKCRLAKKCMVCNASAAACQFVAQ